MLFKVFLIMHSFFYWAVNFFVTVYKTYKLQTSLYLRKKKKEKQMIIAWTAVSVSRFHYTTQLSVHGRGFFRFRFFISVFETKVQQVYLNQLVIMRFLSSLIPFFPLLSVSESVACMTEKNDENKN